MVNDRISDRISELVLEPINPPNPQHSAAVSSKQLQMISDENKEAVTEKKTPLAHQWAC